MIYFWLVIGMVVGSFLNVCIHRLPRSLSIVFPPSHCPACDKKLLPVDLIPLFSFLFLRGKCRRCGGKISARYPVVELLTAAAFAYSYSIAGGDGLNFIFYLVFSSLLLLVFFIDLEQQVIPDAVSFSGVIIGLIFNFLSGGGGQFLDAVLGAAAGWGLLFAIGGAGKFYFKKEAMGEGDLYVAALLGAGLGWEGMLLAVFLAYLLAAAVSLALLFLKKIKMGEYIPFGPALAAGGAVALFWGPQIVAWYGGLFA